MKRSSRQRADSTPSTPRLARSLTHAAGRPWLLTVGLAVLAWGPLIGCESDSFMDPSVLGRWENTPTKVPILDRIAAIEDAKGTFVDYTSPTPEDLYTDPRDYRVGPGDELELELYDIVSIGEATPYTRTVDSQGFIEIPQLGKLYVAGRNVEGVRDLVTEAMRRLVTDNPLAGVTITSQRQQTYTIIGEVDRPGPYFIPSPDYKLLEAITSGGRFPSTIQEVYLIRQVPLDPRAMNPRETALPSTPTAPDGSTPSTPTTPANTPSGEPLIDLIDRLSTPDASPPTTPTPTPTTPPAPAGEAPQTPPTPPPAPRREGEPPINLPSPGLLRSSSPTPASPSRQPQDANRSIPKIDLIEPNTRTSPGGERATAPGTGSSSSWVFLDGQWVQVRPGASSAPQADGAASPPAAPGTPGAGQIVTQRVIRVPLAPLMAGDSSLNVVIRPGDIIHVPSLPTGQVYITGQVARPGVYDLPVTGKLTLQRAIDAAGGLTSIAIPERCDLTRIVGEAQQATIRLDLRAIAEQTQPDVYLKGDDRINIGTNFWALPLAVIRNGFRASYGFGILVDRNFGSDIFGIPPDSDANR